MKHSIKKLKQGISSYPELLLFLGIFMLAASHLSHRLDEMAWISTVPLLLYLWRTKGRRSRYLFSFFLLVTWTAIVYKIISDPIPVVFVFFYSIPITAIHLVGYLLWDRFKTSQYAVVLFPSVMTVVEWVQYSFTPLGSWGAMAYSQLDSLTLLQSASLFGVAGLSFLIYWVNSSFAAMLHFQRLSFKGIVFPTASLVLLFIYGEVRLSNIPSNEDVSVATVGTASTIGGLPLPADSINEGHIEGVLSHTMKAALQGASLVVWNEGSFFLLPENESSWLTRFQELAKQQELTLVAAYVLVTSTEPLSFDNKFVLIDKNGASQLTYLKHEPVPGEPARRGVADFEVVEFGESLLGGAICYDYDFPYIARNYGKLNADIVAVPSSDWKGIDPLHTQMAAVRAIEQGHSVIRSTRFGLSAHIDPYGRMVGQLSSFESEDVVLLGALPARGIDTFYAQIGDAFVYVCIGYMAFLILFELRKSETSVVSTGEREKVMA